jgi:glutathione S-transferase
MSSKIYGDDTPSEIKDAKGIHLITMNTPNGQAVQILLEELAAAYGTKWTTTLINIMTNEQKKGSSDFALPLFPDKD